MIFGEVPRDQAARAPRIAAFDPLEGRAICLPTWRGTRGNPVLAARRFFPKMRAASGDVGARVLIEKRPEAVREVAMDDLPAGQAVLQDVDTPEAPAALKPTDEFLAPKSGRQWRKMRKERWARSALFKIEFRCLDRSIGIVSNTISRARCGRNV